MDSFKVPDILPQDLLLIHDIVGSALVKPVPILSSHPRHLQVDQDCIDSSDSENESEAEVEADLIAIDAEGPDSNPTSDSTSDSESESELSETVENAPEHDESGEEDGGPIPTSGAYFQTKNEVLDTSIVIPSITEVGAEESLEKVGEIMSVTSSTVVVQGVPSDIPERGSERALDSDTLLVFQDRKVLGFVYETFGPTCQPFYQVKFNKEFPLDPERAQIARDVFHVPARSNYIFLKQLAKMKGSDASNVHDEEPAEHELEFSDDEAEAAYKANMKRRRAESRAPSVAASSRRSSPAPSQHRDQDVGHYSRNPYDAHGPYDVGFSAGPSRPPPIPYDDPYSDNYTSATALEPAEPLPEPDLHKEKYEPSNFSRRDRGNHSRHRDDGSRRGRGRGRGRNNRAVSRELSQSDVRIGQDINPWIRDPLQFQSNNTSDYSQHSRPLSPTSLAIARATGHMSPTTYAHPNPFGPLQPRGSGGVWGNLDAFQPPNPMLNRGGNFQTGYVQPHINPRFANAFGMNMIAPLAGNTTQANFRPSQWEQGHDVTDNSGN
ncbi:hypothetical protein H0H93_004924 [Arthromyces matolae]|nr:hypothetical protein H0H93_004924 [Arthromyces matolae]